MNAPRTATSWVSASTRGPRASCTARCARRNSREVLLKRYLGDPPAELQRRGRREFETLQRLQGPSIPIPIELLQSGSLLALERYPGMPLDAWVGALLPSAQVFVEVAIQLVGAVARTPTRCACCTATCTRRT